MSTSRQAWLIAICALPSVLCHSSTDVPMKKVIDLLEGLKKEVEEEGKREAAVYDKFACFCKDNTKTKSDSIIKGKDGIGTLSATIGKKPADKVEKAATLSDTK